MMKTGWTEKKIPFQDVYYSYGPIIDKLKVYYEGLLLSLLLSYCIRSFKVCL